MADDSRPDESAPPRAVPAPVVAAALIAFAAAVCLRDPALVTSPRFYAEEASVYFQHAATHPAAESLVTPHLGY